MSAWKADEETTVDVGEGIGFSGCGGAGEDESGMCRPRGSGKDVEALRCAGFTQAISQSNTVEGGLPQGLTRNGRRRPPRHAWEMPRDMSATASKGLRACASSGLDCGIVSR